MAENAEAVRDMGRMLAEAIGRQAEMFREREDANSARLRNREEATLERFKELVEGQQRYHREDAEQLTAQFERLRIDKENARGRQTQFLPKYDGINMEVDEWLDRVEAVMTGNYWDLAKLLEAIPGSLVGQARRAFDSLTDTDKGTKEDFISSMRAAIDPKAEVKNIDLFNKARRENNESIHTFVDRLRMYLRRAGQNIRETWAQESMKIKIFESLSPTDCKILNATYTKTIERVGPS